MNQDLTQSNLSITRDGVSITVSGPAWLIKDIYERETAPVIRIESANPEAPATPKEWPVFQLGDRVRYWGTNTVGTIEGTQHAPRIYTVRYDRGGVADHVGMMLIKVDDEPQPEPTIEALAQEEEKPKPSRRSWLMSRTPEERSAHARMMVEARLRKQGRTIGVPASVHAPAGHVQEDGLVRFGNGKVNIRGTVYLLSPGEDVFLPGVKLHSVRASASGFGYKVRAKVTQKGVRVWRVK